MSETRLRSEAVPSATRSQRVGRNNAETCERRERLAAEFTERLNAELGPSGASAMRDALVAAATSAYLEIVEGTSRFQRCRASAAQMERLSAVRSQLNRTLRLLGVKPRAANDTTNAPTIADLRREYAERTEKTRETAPDEPQ